ncbi:unnamed protein product [Alopecurus aequalis]
MRIRRCASRLLGHDYASPAPPPFQLPPPPPFELPPSPPPPPPPPPLLQPCSSSAHAAVGLPAPSAEPPCGHSRSPWDLMALLDPADPQELELFKETYFVGVAFRTSWLFPASKPAARVKEEVEDMEEDQQEEEDMAVDMVEEAMAVDMAEEVSDYPWHEVAKKKVAKKAAIDDQDWDKNASSPKKKKKRKERVKTEEDDGVADGGELWMCKKNDGKTWFCRRSVSQPDSYCLYHSEPKHAPQPPSSAASKPSKRRRKRALDVGEGFYYYAGFGPSRSKRQCRSSSIVMDEFPPAEQKEEAPPEEQKEEAPPEEQKEEAPHEEQADLTTAQPQADDADHQVAAAQVDEPICNDMVEIAGYDEEISSDDAFGWNSEPRVVGVNGGIKRKSPLKKRWRKPVKARSLKSLMI